MRPVGIIGGLGWMGGAIAGMALERGVLSQGDLWLSARSVNSEAEARWPGVHLTTDTAALWAECRTVMLSVPPAAFPALRFEAADRLVISVMAGVSAEEIAAATGARRVVRAMPNAAAEIGRSFTPWWASAHVTAEDRTAVSALLGASGAEEEVPEESLIDVFTAMTGSGPAFPALLAAALAAHAETLGVAPDLADRASRHLLAGAAERLLAGTETPAETVQTFIDYAGTTAAGLEAARASGFDEAVARGLDAAIARARSIG